MLLALSAPWRRARPLLLLAAVGAFFALLTAAGTLAVARAQPAEQPRFGGVLKVAMIGEPPTLDLHWTSALITFHIGRHIVETLFTFDASFKPIPHLADRYSVSDGGRRYTVAVRKGVRFHNGKDLTSADVVASLQRWGRLGRAPGAASFWANVADIAATDSSTLVIQLKEPSSALLGALAESGAIYPKEIIDCLLERLAGEGEEVSAGLAGVSSPSPKS